MHTINLCNIFRWVFLSHIQPCLQIWTELTIWKVIKFSWLLSKISKTKCNSPFTLKRNFALFWTLTSPQTQHHMSPRILEIAIVMIAEDRDYWCRTPGNGAAVTSSLHIYNFFTLSLIDSFCLRSVLQRRHILPTGGISAQLTIKIFADVQLSPSTL